MSEESKSAPVAAKVDSVASLREELDKIKIQVKKNSNAIIDTGKHVLNMQIEHERMSLAQTSLGGSKEGKSKSRAPAPVDDDDTPLTSQDIVELVTELQGQLDLLDERSVRRTANAFVSDDSDVIAPLPGTDGQAPSPADGFPENLRQFKDLDQPQTEQWLRYYELLPPDEAEMNQLLDRAGALPDDADVPEESKPAAVSPEEADTQFDTLARYLGLRIRRTKGVW